MLQTPTSLTVQGHPFLLVEEKLNQKKESATVTVVRLPSPTLKAL